MGADACSSGPPHLAAQRAVRPSSSHQPPCEHDALEGPPRPCEPHSASTSTDTDRTGEIAHPSRHSSPYACCLFCKKNPVNKETSSPRRSARRRAWLVVQEGLLSRVALYGGVDEREDPVRPRPRRKLGRAGDDFVRQIHSGGGAEGAGSAPPREVHRRGPPPPAARATFPGYREFWMCGSQI